MVHRSRPRPTLDQGNLALGASADAEQFEMGLRESSLGIGNRLQHRLGCAFAAYYYLPRSRPAKSARTRRVEPGLVIDYSASGQPLGIEITAPAKLSMAALNRVLKDLGCAPLRREDFSPLRTA